MNLKDIRPLACPLNLPLNETNLYFNSFHEPKAQQDHVTENSHPTSVISFQHPYQPVLSQTVWRKLNQDANRLTASDLFEHIDSRIKWLTSFSFTAVQVHSVSVFVLMKLVHRRQMAHKNSPKLVITDRCNKGFNTMLICTLWIQSLSNGESGISCRERRPSLRGWGCSKNQWRIYNFGWPPVSPIFFIFMRFFWEKQVGAPIWKILDPSCICCVGDFRSLLGLALPLENLGSATGTYIFCQFKKIEIEDILVYTGGARSTSKSTTAFLRTVSSPLQHNQLLMARKRHVNSL